MSVLSRSALESSPLADLHTIASELGLDGFRRLRKADLVDRIVAHQGGDDAEIEETVVDEVAAEPEARPRRRRGGRGRGRAEADADAVETDDAEPEDAQAEPEPEPEPDDEEAEADAAGDLVKIEDERGDEDERPARGRRGGRGRGGRDRNGRDRDGRDAD